jgi:tetratricopeptide (TPR) repeat protein
MRLCWMRMRGGSCNRSAGMGALSLILVGGLLAPARAGATEVQGGSTPARPAPEEAGRARVGGSVLDEGASASDLDGPVRAAFEAGDYLTALELLERAYAKTKATRLLFNLGAVHHHLGNCEAARDLYREFVRRDPPEPGRTEARAALQSLEPFCGGDPDRIEPRAAAGDAPADALVARVPSREASSAAPSSSSPSARDVAMWSLLGAGAAAGAGAVLTWRDSARAASDLEELAREAVVRGRRGETYDDCCRARAQKLERSLDRSSSWSSWLGVTSAVLVGSGVTLWLLRSETDAIAVQHGAYTGLEYHTRF